MKERDRNSEGALASLATPRPATLKRINMRRFLEELRLRGPSTRAELTRATGVAPPTSSSIIADLLETGWLEAADSRVTPKGRPGRIFRLATSSAQVVGVLIQIERCFVAPAGLDGIPRKEDSVSFPTPRSYSELLATLAEHTQAFTRDPTRRCLGIGLGVPGLVDEASGRIALSPNLHFLDGQTLGPDLASLTDVQVTCTQEEHALCLAEQHLGKAKNLSDFAVLDVSAGMGMGVVSGGRYMSGRRGFAGEIGHVTVEPNGKLCGCGNRGCLETVATDSAFLNEVRARIQGDITIEEALSQSQKGQIDIRKDLDRTLDYLAIGIAAITNLFNPEAIFIHGRLLDFDEQAAKRLTEKAKERALPPSFDEVIIEKAQGNKLYGALAGLLDSVFATVGPRLS
ncbi:MAG: hypothetical protein BGO01_07405 [Armatimonadetes bacterium 55-13]|nr:ROK family protein [Armatimonadota bacterium]OJU63692.1 MAG: hypothetical protein BGO01_07405 [Armatimonadetes bacterium 55-13]